MSIKGYLQFVEWYFVHRGKVCFHDPPKLPLGKRILHSLFGPRQRRIYRKDRLPTAVLAYICLLVYFPLTLYILPFYIPFGKAFLFSMLALILAFMLLCECEFSLLYYFVLYCKYVRREESINDKLIVEYSVLREYPKSFARMIEKYYSIRFMTGNLYAVKFYLVERQKKNKKASKKDCCVLKISSDKIFFNKQEIFSEKITDVMVLEDFFREVQRSVN